MNMNEAAPVACTLSPLEFRSRASWLRRLTDKALISHTLRGSTARLKYKSGAGSDVERLVREESNCCAFLDFNVASVDDGIELAISAPPEAAGDMRMLLGHLLPHEEQRR